MWLIRAGLASGARRSVRAASFLPIQESPRSYECLRDVNNKCIRGRIKTALYVLSSCRNFLTPAVIFAVKMFWIDVYHPPLGMSACHWLFDCLLTCMSACLSVSTSILPPVSFSLSACLFSLSLPSCLSVKARTHSGPFNICHITSAGEKSIFRDECRLSQGHTHTANIYVMIADSAHRELQNSLPSLCSV